MQEVYSQMSEDELQSVADEAYDLTDIAKQVLKAEIETRRLDIRLQESPPESEEEEPAGDPDFDPSDLDLVVARRVWDEAEARTAKEILDNSRIPSYLGPKNVERLKDFGGNYEKGVDLKVREVDRQNASAALQEHWPAEEGSPEADAEAVVICPKCHSDEVVYESLDKPSSGDSETDAKFNWRCDACGHEWQDDGVEKEA